MRNEKPVPEVPTGKPTFERPDPIVRADVFAHVAFERKDVATMARFLQDFGFLPCSQSSGKSLYFRTLGSLPYGVELIPSDRDAFVGIGLVARERADLEKLASAEGVSIERIDAPGGGERVRLFDPNGFRVDLIHGFEAVEPVPTRAPITQFNTPGVSPRVNAGVRTEVAPSPIRRMGHIVLHTPLFGETVTWYAS